MCFDTAISTQVVTDDIAYVTLTALYNVALNPQLAKRFRIVITKQLLNYFLRKNDIGICCITKCFRSCLYMLLSKLEVSQVCICSKEAVMLAQCLEGRGSFFGGYDSLVKTIENLALVPKNRQVFFDTGIISILKDAALNKDLVHAIGILNALLNVVSDPDELERHGEVFLSYSDSIKALLTSDDSFMELIHSSNEEVCKGLALLLSPSHSEKPGMSVMLLC